MMVVFSHVIGYIIQFLIRRAIVQRSNHLPIHELAVLYCSHLNASDSFNMYIGNQTAGPVTPKGSVPRSTQQVFHTNQIQNRPCLNWFEQHYPFPDALYGLDPQPKQSYHVASS
jgi:hypothetical protein